MTEVLGTTTTNELTDAQQKIIDIETAFFARPGSKEQAIRDAGFRSDISYYTQLNAMIDLPAFREAHPVLANRLDRIRHAGRRNIRRR
jgi:hypothetical protein